MPWAMACCVLLQNAGLVRDNARLHRCWWSGARVQVICLHSGNVSRLPPSMHICLHLELPAAGSHLCVGSAMDQITNCLASSSSCSRSRVIPHHLPQGAALLVPALAGADPSWLARAEAHGSVGVLVTKGLYICMGVTGHGRLALGWQAGAISAVRRRWPV